MIENKLMATSEACTRPSKLSAEDTLPSKNIERLRDIFSGSEFMNRPVVGYGKRFLKSPTDSFAAVQLSLTHLALDLEMNFRARRTDYDIAVVYKYGLPTPPIFLPKRVSLESLLHIRNFWKRHLTNSDEATFYDSFRALSANQRPKAWSVDLTTVLSLGTHWLGYYCENFSICMANKDHIAKANFT